MAEWENVGKIQGEKGEKGEQGEQGLRGEKGEQGEKGQDGIFQTERLEVDALPSDYPQGVSYQYHGLNTEFPTNLSFIMTFRTGSSAFQIVFPTGGNTTQSIIRYRRTSGGNWLGFYSLPYLTEDDEVSNRLQFLEDRVAELEGK